MLSEDEEVLQPLKPELLPPVAKTDTLCYKLSWPDEI